MKSKPKPKPKRRGRAIVKPKSTPAPLRIQVCMFTYGGIVPEAHECIQRDMLECCSYWN